MDFHENETSDSRPDPCGPTGRHMAKLRFDRPGFDFRAGARIVYTRRLYQIRGSCSRGILLGYVYLHRIMQQGYHVGVRLLA
jgi:hypothetical protein